MRAVKSFYEGIKACKNKTKRKEKKRYFAVKVSLREEGERHVYGTRHVDAGEYRGS